MVDKNVIEKLQSIFVEAPFTVDAVVFVEFLSLKKGIVHKLCGVWFLCFLEISFLEVFGTS